jgi:hypothetical protein
MVSIFYLSQSITVKIKTGYGGCHESGLCLAVFGTQSSIAILSNAPGDVKVFYWLAPNDSK